MPPLMPALDLAPKGEPHSQTGAQSQKDRILRGACVRESRFSVLPSQVDRTVVALKLSVDPSLDVPPSRQLVEGVMDALAKGLLEVGDQLPSVREMAAQALVNPNTVGKAWRELGVRGVVIGRNGAGVFVTPKGPSLARELRREATLEGLRRAMDQALATGHEPEGLLEFIELHLAVREREGV